MIFKMSVIGISLSAMISCSGGSFYGDLKQGKYLATTDCEEAAEKSGEVTYTSDYQEVIDTCGEIETSSNQRQFLVVNGAKFGLNEDCYRYYDFLDDMITGVPNDDGRRCDFVGHRESKKTKGIFLCYYGEKERLCTISLR